MNILIPYSWLKDFLKTDLTPKQFADVVSASGPSIERWHPTEDGDIVFDVEVTTNRIDVLSVFGLAREAFAIITNDKQVADLIEPQMPPVENTSGTHYDLYADVDETLCSRFTAVVLDGISVGQSPEFIKERLEKVGERSLNNVVDITNYVMWELGQPMHVYDYDKIAGHKMVVRKSRVGESVETLDGSMRKVPEGSIVIEDADGVMDLAGIMGGKRTAVDQDTKRVLLFVQTYNPHVIRKTSMHMAFRTEAASRFEKGLDPEAVMPALQRAAYLLEEYASGTIASDVYDIYPHPYQPKQVSVSLADVQQVIGEPIDIDVAMNILITLGFQVSEASNVITAEVPSFRAHDIFAAEDLIEEIARLYGYHNIPSVLPTGQIPMRPANKTAVLAKRAKYLLKDWGFSELFTNSATSQTNVEKLGIDPKACVKIKNPLSEDFVYMRTHLLETMLPVIGENIIRFPNLSVFELSKVYEPQKRGLPNEKRMLQLITTNTDLLKLKGIVEELLSELGVSGVTVAVHQSSDKYEPNTTGIFVRDGKEIGHIGMLSAAIAKNYGIMQPIATAKLFFDDVVAAASTAISYKPIPKYPALTEDISFLLPVDATVGPIIEAIQSVSPLIVDVALLDTYVGKGVGDNQKSLTLRITYQSDEKALAENDVLPLREKIQTKLQNEFQATLRS